MSIKKIRIEKTGSFPGILLQFKKQWKGRLDRMLENSLAEKLIEQVTKYTSYNVNIMNEQGVIIASRNPERIGKFHEVAWQIVHGTTDIMVTENDNEYPGVLSGINMIIEIEGKREGVVGVTGNPDEIRPIALIIKMAIETLIKYENQKMQAFRRQTRKDRFMEMLTQKQYRAPQDIQKLAAELNYREDLIRIPILCHLQSASDQEAFLHSIKNGREHLTQDISFQMEDRYILIFKTLKGEHLFSDYKFLLADYLKSTLKWMREEEICCTFYVGTFQTSFSQYYYSYQHCKWLETHIFGEHQAFYFYDFIGEYITSCIPRQELQQIFNVFAQKLPEDFRKNYIEIVGSLIQNNFNIQNAARQCFMHKNTFTYRYNKIREVLRLDHQRSMDDTWMLICLYLYLKL